MMRFCIPESRCKLIRLLSLTISLTLETDLYRVCANRTSGQDSSTESSGNSASDDDDDLYDDAEDFASLESEQSRNDRYYRQYVPRLPIALQAMSHPWLANEQPVNRRRIMGRQ